MMTILRSLRSTAGLALAAIVLLLAPLADAQNSPVLDSFSPDPDAPIEIEADTLEVDQDKQVAIFSGNVLAKQGPMRLRADTLNVSYATESNDAGGVAAGGTTITRIDARGRVFVTSDDDQSAQGNWAIYDVPSRLITMGDAVVLQQGDNVVRGNKLTIDLNTGRSKIAGGGGAGDGESGGRVRGLFLPPE